MRFITFSTLFLSSLVSAGPTSERRQLARGFSPQLLVDFVLASSPNSTSTLSAASPTSTVSPIPTSSAGSTNSSGAQTSLTLLSSLIAPNFAQNGLNLSTTEAGEIASLTSTNNFINWCATLPQLPLTNGEQLKNGSCNPAPMGAIPSTTHMPSVKFVTPHNLALIPPNTTFEITLAVRNFATGYFVNLDTNYFAAPQQLDPITGLIQGHAHLVIEGLQSLHQTTPTDPTKFAFFAALNGKADAKGYLYANVTGGLPKGVYRLSTITAAMNHQPVLLPIAERGVADDMIYFTVGGKVPTTNATASSAFPHHPHSATVPNTPVPIQTVKDT